MAIDKISTGTPFVERDGRTMTLETYIMLTNIIQLLNSIEARVAAIETALTADD